ncbi:MAG: hypothetical protein ACK2UO_20985 [Caldilineaceae bacterium]
MASQPDSNHIGELNEKPLHALLKDWYAQPGDRLETTVDGYVVDIVRDDLLIEIQTRNFSSIRTKLSRLVRSHRLHLVHPIAAEKWIVSLPKDLGAPWRRRKSPKHGSPVMLFAELTSIPRLIESPNFTLELLLIQEEEVRFYDGKRAWRRKGWVVQERRLLDVMDRLVFATADELSRLLPESLDDGFDTADLAAHLNIRRRLAQQMAYCLRECGGIVPVGKRGNAICYARRR